MCAGAACFVCGLHGDDGRQKSRGFVIRHLEVGIALAVDISGYPDIIVTMPQHSAPVARAQEYPADELQAKFVRGLGDPTRLRIVRYLLEGPRSVSEIVGHLSMPQNRVSNHLACLKWCGYVVTERRGRSIIYEIADERVRSILELTRLIVAENAQRIATCMRIPES